MCTTDTNPCLPSSLSTHISTGVGVGTAGPLPSKTASQPFESFLSHLGLLGDEQGCGLPYAGLFRGEWHLAASELSVLFCSAPSSASPLSSLQSVPALL